MTVDIYAPTPSDTLSLVELKLYHRIMDYRAAEGLDPIPLSASLTLTAGRHALDSYHNFHEAGRELLPGTNLHSWSDAPYYSDHRDPRVMWDAPERLGTPYPTAGFEISGRDYPGVGAALAGWKGSSGHDAVIVNSGAWSTQAWQAIGVGVVLRQDKPYYHVWFGAAADPAGPPAVLGAGGDDVIEGTVFSDRLYGRRGDDEIDGARGEDDIVGGGGDDVLDGGGGQDRIWGGAGRDALNGGAVGDLLSGGGGSDRLKGGGGGDEMYGGGGRDVVSGQRGGDVMSGGAGGDRMRGGGGDDFLQGDEGDDLLIGGGGADAYAFASGHGVDRIRGFAPGEDEMIVQGRVFADLTIEDRAEGAWIDYGGGAVLALGVSAARIGEEDFTFV